jgi:hypothetical protein
MNDLPPIHPVRWVVTAVVIAIELVAAATLPWLFYLRSLHAQCVRGNELRASIVAYVERLAHGSAHATPAQIAKFDRQTEDAFKPHPC